MVIGGSCKFQNIKGCWIHYHLCDAEYYQYFLIQDTNNSNITQVTKGGWFHSYRHKQKKGHGKKSIIYPQDDAFGGTKFASTWEIDT